MKKVVLDCGSHLGESVKKFRNILNDITYEYHMFEANTYLYNQIELNPEFDDCKKFNFAISNKNDVIKLWGCVKNKNSVGSTTQKSKANWDSIEETDYIEVKSINLSEYIKNNFNKEDYIILKLDIEGSEYDVLRDLIDTEVIHYVNELFCEFHSCWMSSEFLEKEQQIKNDLNKINLNLSYWDALS
jgi:FkbM family methyltransferase